MSLKPGTRLGSYEVVGQLGQGGMGEVYRARDTELDRDVALKILPQAFAADPERLARFQREAKTLATLNHPNIASIYGLESTPDGRALVMELVQGQTLGDLIRAKFEVHSSKFEIIQWAVPIARQIADALECAHEQGIVHRDLKPANVMVRDDGTVKILDFGLAKAMAPEGGASGSDVSNSPTLTAHTQMGMILGTAAYMAPEQARGKSVDKRADIWAFGCVLYEMLTGARLFKGDEVSDVLAAVLRQDIDWTALPSDTPPMLRGLVARCLDRDLKTRLRDIGEARVALSRVNDPTAQGSMAQNSAGAISQGGLGPSAQSGFGAPASTGRLALRELVAWCLALASIAAALGIWLTRASATAPTNGAVVRTMIPPPDGTVFDFDITVGPAVISPNGQLIAFSARSRDGRIQLWLRPLDSANARAIDGTDGASFPFWSPDSRSIGYYSPGRGRLERVDVAGGAPVEIVKAGFVRGASWGPDGTIAYDASDSGTRIAVVNVAGGAPPRPVVEGGSPRSPWILPDGKHLLYFNRDKLRIHVVGIDGTGDTPVVEATSSAIYANGKLLFMREDTLLAQSFDLSSRTVSGTPDSIARGIQTLLGDPRGVFSASDTGVLLFQDGVAGAATSLAWFDHDGKRQSLVGEVGTARGVFLSPDNQTAVIGMLDAEAQLSLWRVTLANNQRIRLTYEIGTNDVSSFLTWAPDGRSIAYGAKRDGKIIINRLASAGGQPERLFEVPNEHTLGTVPRVTAWTKDATTLIYASQIKGGLWKLPLKSAAGAPLTSIPFISNAFNAQNAQLSPNERWIVYQGSVGGGTVSGIFADAYPSGGLRREVADRGTLPRWSADGKSLFFAIDNQLSVVDVTESDGSIQFSPPRGLMPVIVGRGFSYDVAKDSRILALVTSETRASRPLTLVQNWLATLAAK